MKLIFMIDNQNAFGGGEYAQVNFAKTMAEKGHQVTIFAAKKHPFIEEIEFTQNLIIRYRKTINIPIKKMGIGKINYLWKQTYQKLVIEPYVKIQKPNWIIGYLKTSAIDAQKIGKKLGIKSAQFVFENPIWMSEQLGIEWEKEWSNKKFRKSWEKTKKSYEKSTILIPNSKLARKNMLRWIKTKNVTEQVYPGFNEKIMNKINQKLKSETNEKLSKEKLFEKRKYDILYNGRLNELKNVDEILKAVAKTGKKYKIVMMGEGEERKNLENLAKKLKLDVEFKGKITDKEKWELLPKTKLLVFPTSFEGFGMPPLDSLVAGSQVLSSDIPILKEVYEEKIHYFKLHNVEEMAKKIEGILTRKIKHKLISKKFLMNFTWNKSADKIEQILNSN